VSRARDLASSGVTSTVLSEKAPLASPDFTGTVDLTGTTVNLDNDQISGDKVSGGTIGAGTFDGTIGSNATFPSGTIIWVESGITTAQTGTATSSTGFTTISDEMRVNITASNAGLCSKIVVMFHTSINVISGSGDTRFNARIVRVRNGVSLDLGDGSNWYAGSDGTGPTLWSTPTIIVTDASPNGDHDHSYEFQVRKGGASSSASGNITPNHAGMHYLIMGVK
jgi:hypothetical protein